MEEKEKNNIENKCLSCGKELPIEKRTELYCSLRCKRKFELDLSILDLVDKPSKEEEDKLECQSIQFKSVIDYLPEILETVNKCAVLFAPQSKKKSKKKKKKKKKTFKIEQEQLKSEGRIKSFIKSKIEYARLTFILSVIGFIGSIGFYFGVLRQIYSPALDKQKIEQLQTENQQLKESVFELVDELNKDGEKE